jgi:hypothetical protein
MIIEEFGSKTFYLTFLPDQESAQMVNLATP